jgi:hypothetical protein
MRSLPHPSVAALAVLFAGSAVHAQSVETPALNAATVATTAQHPDPAPLEAATPESPARATTSRPERTAMAAPAVPAPILTEQVSVPGTAVLAGRVRTEVRAPYATVAAVVTDFAHYRDFFPQVRESRVVHRLRGQAEVYVRVELLRGLGMLWALSRFNVLRGPASTVVDGVLVDGNLRRFDVRFDVHPVAGDPTRSEVTMQLLGIPAFLLPHGLLSGQQARWAARGLEQLRARAESMAQAQAAAR